MDISHLASYQTEGIINFYAMFTTNAGCDYTFDISYIALVDTLDEARSLLADGDTYWDLGTSWSNVGTEYDKNGDPVPKN